MPEAKIVKTVFSTTTDQAGELAWSAFASDLGFPPGQWPDTMAVSLPNGWVFTYTRTEPLMQNGEIAGMIYKPNHNEMPIITVYND